MNEVWTPQALAAALGVLTIAVCAAIVRMAQTYAAVVNILEAVNRSVVPVRGAKSAPVRGGGGADTPLIRSPLAGGVLPVPNEAQRADVTVSSSPAWTGSVDCGPECVVAVLAYEHHQETVAQLLRLRYFGVIDMRLTNADDLVGMLKQNGVAAHSRYVDGPTAALEIDRALNQSWPCIALLRYSGGSTLHWYVVKGHPGNTWVMMDPWIGATVTMDDATWASRYQGQYVHVDSAPPLPGV